MNRPTVFNEDSRVIDGVGWRPLIQKRLMLLDYLDSLNPGGEYTTGQNPTPPVSQDANSSDGGSWFSGLADIFSGVATDFSAIYRTVNAPTPPQTIATARGTAVYNPATGQYTYPGGVPTSIAGLSGTTLLIGAVILILLLRK